MDNSSLSLIVSICSLIVTLIGLVWIGGVKMGQIEVKVDTMWSFLMRRAESEIINHGLGVKNSPIVINDDAKHWVDSLSDELHKLYQQMGSDVTDEKLALEIEKRFGEKILKDVCIPHGLYAGACLLIALEVAKENTK